MSADRTLSPEPALVRVGGWCALAGAVVSVAAGVGFGNLTNEAGAEAVVAAIAQRPEWYWPTVHLAFILGVVLWLGAFAAVASTLPAGISRTPGQLATVILIVGVAVHVVDSSISGFGLNAIATAWQSASVQERPELIRRAHGLLQILNGIWPSVHGLFHGVPFVLLGAAVAIGGKGAIPSMAWEGGQHRWPWLGGRSRSDVLRRQPGLRAQLHSLRAAGKHVDDRDGGADVAPRLGARQVRRASNYLGGNQS